MISQLFTQDCFKIISLFSISPGSRFNRTEIKNRLFLNNIPLDKALSRLLSSGILRREKNFYSINFEHEDTKIILELCTKQYRKLKELPLAIYNLLIDIIYELSLNKGIEIYLFGSYAKLVYKENSDIDLAIVYTKELPLRRFSLFFGKLEKNYSKKIEVHYFKKADFFRNKKDPLVRSILRDGMLLGISRC